MALYVRLSSGQVIDISMSGTIAEVRARRKREKRLALARTVLEGTVAAFFILSVAAACIAYAG